MIPKMKIYRFTMVAGDTIYVNTCTKQLAWIIFRHDAMQYWGEEVLKVGVVRKVPEGLDVPGGGLAIVAGANPPKSVRYSEFEGM